MRSENHCIITGILLQKNRNADNKDIRRPVADLEFVSTDNDDNISFEKIPLLFSELTLSKALSGYSVGEIVLVSGELRTDEENGLYIDVETISRIFAKTESLKSVVFSRAELLQLSQRFNMVNIVGEYKDNVIRVKRDKYSRGDLTREDNIPISLATNNHASPQILNKNVYCTGFLGSREDCEEIHLCINKIFALL